MCSRRRNLVAEIARVASTPAEGYTEDVEVRAARSLTVEEIVARHQAQARRQAARVTHSIASGTMTLTFEAPGFPAPVTIASETIIYSAPDRTELEQRSIRVNGIEFRGSGIPRLPIIEPERVVSPPLAITLSDLYRYRLDGEDTRDGVRCYVVAFTPIDPSASPKSLFSGRAWIAMKTFAMLRVAAAQTRLRGAIVSSEQVDDFREAAPGIWLLAQSDVRQIYEGPGHRTPIHRLLRLSTHEVNPPNFASRLQSAYASSSVMLRDTAAGYRYLKRDAPQRDGEWATRRNRPGGRCSRRQRADARRGRDHRSEHQRTVAVRRFELRQLRPVWHRHAAQCVLWRQLCAGGLLDAVGRRLALATRGPRVRDRDLVQRSILPRRCGDLRRKPASTSGSRVSVAAPSTDAEALSSPGIRTGLHSPPGGAGNGARVHRSAPTRCCTARGSRSMASAAGGPDRSGGTRPYGPGGSHGDGPAITILRIAACSATAPAFRAPCR